jgi:acyl-CoA thioester hydrolase
MPPHPDALSGRLTATGHELIQRVYFEDTDFSGRVYHARYLHFMERGRSDYLRLLGIHHRELAAKGLAFAVSRIEVDFLKPASIDDVVRVRTSPESVGGARILLKQEIFRGDERLVSACVTVALTGPAGRAMRLPVSIRNAFRRSVAPTAAASTTNVASVRTSAVNFSIVICMVRVLGHPATSQRFEIPLVPGSGSRA